MHPTSCKSAMPFLATFYLLLAIFTYAQSGWGPDTRLVFMQGGGWYPRAACCGDTIHLVWWQHYAHDEVFYKRSTDAGLTWGEDVMLSVEDDRSSVLPWIAVDGNYLHVVWQQYGIGICYRKSTDGGNSWLMIDTIPNGGSGNPSICAVGSNVYVVAYRSDGKVIFTKSTDNGTTWLPSQNIGFNCATRPRIKYLGNQSIL
ncbi:MAG: sialidase family protein, partial [candidate division WOR-3 bacterium]